MVVVNFTFHELKGRSFRNYEYHINIMDADRFIIFIDVKCTIMAHKCHYFAL